MEENQRGNGRARRSSRARHQRDARGFFLSAPSFPLTVVCQVQKLSKAAIYCLHRGELQEARAKLSHAHKLALAFLPLISEFQHLRKGTFSSAIEEFVEGKAFEYFLLHGKLVPMADHELKGLCDAEEYLGEFGDAGKKKSQKQKMEQAVSRICVES